MYPKLEHKSDNEKKSLHFYKYITLFKPRNILSFITAINSLLLRWLSSEKIYIYIYFKNLKKNFTYLLYLFTYIVVNQLNHRAIKITEERDSPDGWPKKRWSYNQVLYRRHEFPIRSSSLLRTINQSRVCLPSLKKRLEPNLSWRFLGYADIRQI